MNRLELLRSMGAAVLVYGNRPGFDVRALRSHIMKATADGSFAAAVAVAHRGTIVWEEGFGFANREARVAATDRTPFCLASLTKPFTATAVMTLVQDGLLQLDAPLRSAAAYPRIGATSGARHITLRDLGAHSSGLPTLFEMVPSSDGASTTADVLLRYDRPAYCAGCTYEYSNIGYSVLGKESERVTRRSFSALLQDRVLRPMRMHDAFFGEDSPRVARAARRYDESGHVIPAYRTATPPSGELYASAHDVIRFALLHLKHRIYPVQPLNEASIEEMRKSVLVGDDGGASTFGWFKGRTDAGVEVIFKDGGQPGVSTALYLVPDYDLACLVLTNRSDPDGWAQDCADRLVRTFIPDWTQPNTLPTLHKRAAVHLGAFKGQWIEKGDVEEPVSITIDPSNRHLTYEFRGSYLIAKTRIGAIARSCKFALDGDELMGRILDTEERPGFLRSLPRVVRLARR